MKTGMLILAGTTIASLVCMGGFLVSGQAVSQGEKKTTSDKTDFSYQQPSPEEMQKMMQTYMATTQPGKYHKWLEKMIGEWDTTSTIWMGGPGSPPTKSKGTAKYTWAVPGKWLRVETESTMMGMQIKGFGVSGYDNFKKKFVGSWFDSLSTALLTFEGSLDETGAVLNQWGPMDEPMTGEHDKPVRYTTRIVDENKFIFEIHDLAIGGDKTKVIEVEYRRKN